MEKQGIIHRQTLENSNKEIVIFEGILEKQPAGVYINWHKLYCKITLNKFIYHETNEKNSRINGYLDFDLFSTDFSMTNEKHPEWQ